MSTPRGEGSSTPRVADSEEPRPAKAALRPFMLPGVGRVMVFSNTAIFDSSPDDLQSNKANAIKSERASSSSSVTDTRRSSAPPPSPPQTLARHPSPPSPSSPPAKRTRRQTNLAANPASTPAAPTPSSSSTPLLGLYDYPGPCARVAPPLPVPNLTKQSRGRKVPTVDSPPAPSPSTPPTSPPDSARAYICNVEGCAKCFSRREHLKRHVLSIHTHEKPFKCPFPSCEKFFSRRDNLIQHGKVHGESPTLKNNSSKRKASSSGRKAR